MKSSCRLIFSLSLLLVCFTSTEVKASLSTSRLNRIRSSSTYSGSSKVFIEAVTFSLLQPQNKAKLVGAWKPYLETGYHVYQVKDSVLALFTSNGHSPASFHGTFIKGGIGLPWGLSFETGITQVVSEHMVSGIYASMSAQIFDFAHLVYTDMVPCMTMSVTGMQVAIGPQLYSISASTSIGAYLRQTLAQFAFVIQGHYANLDYPSANKLLYRYGVISSLPIYKKTYLETDILFPDLSGTLSLGLRF